jgi:hypothetical protein
MFLPSLEGMHPSCHGMVSQSFLSATFLQSLVTLTCVLPLCSHDFDEATLLVFTEHVFRAVSHDTTIWHLMLNVHSRNRGTHGSTIQYLTQNLFSAGTNMECCNAAGFPIIFE